MSIGSASGFSRNVFQFDHPFQFWKVYPDGVELLGCAIPTRTGHWEQRKRISSGPHQISDSTIEYRSIGSTDETLQDWLALSRRAWRELRQNTRATDNAADDLFMSSQASLSYFLYIFMSSCNFLISFWCRKSVLKQQIHCKSMFNCQKNSRLRRAKNFFANLTFILVLDIKNVFLLCLFHSCTRYHANIPNARENVRSHTVQYFSIAGGLR